MGRFKGKKKSNKIILCLGLFLISMAFSISYLYRQNLIENDTIIDYLINDNLGVYHRDLTDVDFLLKYALNLNLTEDSIEIPALDESDEPAFKEEDKQDEYDEPAFKEEDKQDEYDEPLVYIYNSHQEEKYQSGNLAFYNVTPTVLVASKMLKEYLNLYGIKAIVEENSISDMLHSLNLAYSSSYKVSRMLLESAKKDNPSLTYFIDLHRDSSKYESTTTTIDNETYAKILFVVGLDHDNYEPNLALAEEFRTRINAYNSSLFRGVMKKSGKGVNGIYNQDFSPKTMLIEVGGQYNNISEVNNTLKVLAKLISEYIKDDQNGQKEKD